MFALFEDQRTLTGATIYLSAESPVQITTLGVSSHWMCRQILVFTEPCLCLKLRYYINLMASGPGQSVAGIIRGDLGRATQGCHSHVSSPPSVSGE